MVKDEEAIRSSPSALFLLILNFHRLVYVKETKDAPSKDSFKSTLLSFLRDKHEKYVQREYLESEEKRRENPELQKRTKKAIRESVPKPTLELIPLTSEDSIEQFIRKYDVLKSIEIAFSDRNDETDNDPFFEQLQQRKDRLGSTASTVKHKNNKGLSKDEAIKEVVEATAQGNQHVSLNGTDVEGDTLRGNNEQFQLRKLVDDLHADPKRAAKQLYGSFMGLVEDDIIKLPEVAHKALDIVRSIADRLL